MISRCILLLVLFGNSYGGYAQKVFELTSNFESENISQYFYVFNDSTKLLSLKDVSALQEERFVNIKTNNPNYGFRKSVIWVKFKIWNATNQNKQLYLVLEYAPLDKIDLFGFDEQKKWVSLQPTIGDRAAFSQRTIGYAMPTLNINVQAGQTHAYLMKIETSSSFQFPATLYQDTSLTQHISLTEFLYGLFYGVLLIMIVYNLVLYFAIGHKSYLYYCIYTFFYGISQASLSGHTFEHLWPNSIWWANAIVPMGLCLGAMGAVLFMISFLNTAKYLPRFHYVLIGFAALFSLFALLGLFLDYSIMIKISTSSMLVLAVLELVVGIIVWSLGNNKSAIYFVFSWLVFLIGIFTLSLIAMGILPNHPLLRTATPIGAMLQVIGLSFALADRVNAIRKEKAQAQAEALASTEENARIILQQNETLERKVEERTHELQQKQDEILVQNEELFQQREEITTQRDFIEIKNQELTELNLNTSKSIEYASQIQRAILPKEEIIKKNVQDFFVLYLPKDVVSGDFYWYSKIENMQFFAAVDCTGHGVPGAFMSMIGNTLLNKIINENKIYEPAKILDILNEGVISSLKQKETGNNDGMDICLCCIEELATEGTYKIAYAGAKRPLYIFQNNDIKELKGSRSHIGGSGLGTQHGFEQETCTAESGDVLYLSTDGFVDNPNPERIKFGNDKFKTLLLLYGKETLEKQKSFLLDELYSFQKSASQRDDILVMGVKI